MNTMNTMNLSYRSLFNQVEIWVYNDSLNTMLSIFFFAIDNKLRPSF